MTKPLQPLTDWANTQHAPIAWNTARDKAGEILGGPGNPPLVDEFFDAMRAAGYYYVGGSSDCFFKTNEEIEGGASRCSNCGCASCNCPEHQQMNMTKTEANQLYRYQKKVLKAERKDALIRTVEASHRLKAALKGSTLESRANLSSYIHGWIEQGAKQGFGIAPDQILNSMADYLEREKTRPRCAEDSPSAQWQCI